MNQHPSRSPDERHALWTRSTHWIGAASILTLIVSGVVILMAHPRLYWGEVGNDLTPAMLELPISRNHQHGGWETAVPFTAEAGSPVSASRTYEIFNQNGWGRSLHFLSAWILVATGTAYWLAGFLTGHVRRHLVPRAGEWRMRRLGQDFRDHLRLRIPRATSGPQYGPLQKFAYLGVVFVALPVMLLTGLAMSPAVTAGVPMLAAIFGGYQSARTIHFIAFAALVLFLLAHVVMIAITGFVRHMRAMTVGE